MLCTFELPQETVGRLENLAHETGIAVQEFIVELVDREDRSRHVKKLPFQGDVRVKCSASYQEDAPLTRFELEQALDSYE